MKRRILLLLTLAIPQLYGAASSEPDFRLIAAVNKGDIEETIRRLATKDIDVNLQTDPSKDGRYKNTGGETALHIAVEKLRVTGDKRYSEIALLLIKHPSININKKNNAGARPIHKLAGFAHEPTTRTTEGALVQDNYETQRPDLVLIAQALIEIDPNNVNAKDNRGNTPLHWAVIRGYSDLVQALIDARESNINAQDTEGQTPLMKAAQKGYTSIMQQLINAGANVNMQDTNKGRAALHWVQRMREGSEAKFGNQMTKERAIDALRVLLNAGADPTIKDKVTPDNLVARSAIDWATEKSPWPADNNEELALLMTSPFAQTASAEPSTSQPQSSSSSSHAEDSETGWKRILKNIEDYREIAKFGDQDERARLLKKFRNDAELLGGLHYGYYRLGDARAETILAKLGLLEEPGAPSSSSPKPHAALTKGRKELEASIDSYVSNALDNDFVQGYLIKSLSKLQSKELLDALYTASENPSDPLHAKANVIIKAIGEYLPMSPSIRKILEDNISTWRDIEKYPYAHTQQEFANMSKLLKNLRYKEG